MEKNTRELDERNKDLVIAKEFMNYQDLQEERRREFKKKINQKHMDQNSVIKGDLQMVERLETSDKEKRYNTS